MDRMRIVADLESIRQLAESIIFIDDDFTTNTADAKEIHEMASHLIELLEEATDDNLYS